MAAVEKKYYSFSWEGMGHIYNKKMFYFPLSLYTCYNYSEPIFYFTVGISPLFTQLPSLHFNALPPLFTFLQGFLSIYATHSQNMLKIIIHR